MIPKPELRVVAGTNLPQPPYEKFSSNKLDFDIDLPRIKCSKTWLLCPQPYRNHLLRLWVESWDSTPAGTYENDDEIIAARIDLGMDVFQGIREYLMRGWVLHSNSLLYHPYITEMVISIIAARNADNRRKKKPADDSPPENPSPQTPHPGTDLSTSDFKPSVLRLNTSVLGSLNPAESGGFPRIPTEKNTHVSSASKPGRKNTPPAAECVYPESFLQCWQIWKNRLPREGGNSKSSAFKQWQARINQGHPEEELYEGTLRYAAYCESAGTVGTRYVKMASTFYGQDRHFQEDWIPAKNGNGNGKPSLAERAQAVIDHFANESRIIDGECYETH